MHRELHPKYVANIQLVARQAHWGTNPGSKRGRNGEYIAGQWMKQNNWRYCSCHIWMKNKKEEAEAYLAYFSYESLTCQE